MTGYPRNPIEELAAHRRSLRRTVVVGLLLLACALAWAMWPIGRAAPGDIPASQRGVEHAAASPGKRVPLPRLDLAAFDVPVWRVPPVPAPTPPVRPLTLRLMAIETIRSVTNAESGMRAPTSAIFAAIVYNPENDTFETLREGGVVAGYRVSRITASGVVLTDQSRGERTLTLDSAHAETPAAMLGGGEAGAGRAP